MKFEDLNMIPYRRYKLGEMLISAGFKWVSWRARRAGNSILDHNSFLIGWGRAVNQWLTAREMRRDIERFMAANPDA
jgi:hypothetical protein